MKFVVAVAIGLMTSTVMAQPADDIAAQIADISGKDPVKASLAAEKALSTPNRVHRSLALEATLKSSDGRVRAIGFSYLVGIQRQFIVDILIPSDLSGGGNTFINTTRQNSTLIMKIHDFDKTRGLFTSNHHGWIEMPGTVARDGITFNLHLPASDGPCVMRLNAIEYEYLTGTVRCGNYTFKVRSALP